MTDTRKTALEKFVENGSIVRYLEGSRQFATRRKTGCSRIKMRQHDSNRRHYGAGGSMQTRCNVFILARHAQSGESSPPRLWYLNFNADLYFSIYVYIYIYFSLSRNRGQQSPDLPRLRGQTPPLLLGEDIDPPSSVFAILCRYTYKCRELQSVRLVDYLQDWIFKNWI